MKFAFLNRGLNIHQVALADAMYEILGDDFVFIEIGGNKLQTGSFRNIAKGKDFSKRPYLLRMNSSSQAKSKAIEIIKEADVIRTSAEPIGMTYERIKEGKLTFRSSERLFKRTFLLHHPYSLYKVWQRYIYLSHPNYRFLCQSAYLPNDIGLLRGPIDRCYKFAYFSQLMSSDLEEIHLKKSNDKIRIIWCARFIDWKHPELPVYLAKRMIDSGRHNFEIKMIGADNTPLWKQIKRKIEKDHLEGYVILTGGIPNTEVIEEMKKSNIFLFTSDRNEGWGVVLNEAMSAGCACISSNEIGSTPYLIKNKKNGLIFKSKSLDSLVENVMMLYDNPMLCKEYGDKAHSTITGEWSAKTAAKRLIELSDSILDGHEVLYEEGPCSKAYTIPSKSLVQQ